MAMWNLACQPRVWQVRCFSSYEQALRNLDCKIDKLEYWKIVFGRGKVQKGARNTLLRPLCSQNEIVSSNFPVPVQLCNFLVSYKKNTCILGKRCCQDLDVTN